MVDVDHGVTGLEPLQQVPRHDPSQRARAPNPYRPEQLAVGDQHDLLRASGETAVEAAIDQRERGRCRCGGDLRDRCGHDIDIGEQLRQTSRLVGGQHHAQAFLAPAGDRRSDVGDGRRRQAGLVPSEGVAAGRRTLGLRLPGQLQGARFKQASLPVAGRGVGLGPALGQLPGPLQLGAALIGLRPQEVCGSADVARFIEQPHGWTQVVESGSRGEVPGPDLSRIAQRTRLESREVDRERLGELRGASTQPSRQPALWPCGQDELAGGQQRRVLDRSHSSLVGWIEGAQRLDLIPEPLRADGQRLPGGEHVDDAATSRELATAAHLGHVLVAHLDQGAEDAILREAHARTQDHRLARQLVQWQRALEESLHAGDQDASRGPGAAPFGQRGDTGGALVTHQLRTLICQRAARLEGQHGGRVGQPGRQLLGHSVGDLGVARDPHQPLAAGLDERGAALRRRRVG